MLGIEKNYNRMVVLFATMLLMFICSGCGAKKVYVPTSTKSVKINSHKGSSIARTAISQVGVRYKWGGESPQTGFDCSGLLWWSCRQNGIKIPRVTWQQVEHGQKVSFRHLRVGDLVFFDLSFFSKSYHSGIYIGNGYFVHSPKSGNKVRKESINKDYWRSNFVTGRRVVY